MVAHPVRLRGPRFLGQGERPALLERTDPRFMASVRAELSSARLHDRLRNTVMDQASRLKLFQPVHRTFHLLLTEAFCDVPGKPRLDPAKVESAGLVVRRRTSTADWAWMKDDQGIRGWTPLATQSTIGFVDADADPEADRRKKLTTGVPALDRRLRSRRALAESPPSEVVTPLFPLPVPAQEATGATLFFGVVPTSANDSVVDDELEPPAARDLIEGFSPYLQALDERPGVPSAGQVLRRPTEPPDGNTSQGRIQTNYTNFIQQMVVQFDVLGQGPLSEGLLAELDRHELVLRPPREENGKTVDEERIGFGQHIVDAARVLMLPPTHERAASSVKMPVRWLLFEPEDVARIADKAQPIMRQRLQAMRPVKGQFTEPDTRLYARAFIRVRRDDGCPPDLVWSKETQEFTVARWFESGPGNAPVVELPDPLTQGLDSFKPNVAFNVPSSLVGVLRNNKPDDLIEGKGAAGSGFGVAWLCGFNIPLITICAFIVLSIFLSLLNIIFWWLPFIRICIPIPRRN